VKNKWPISLRKLRLHSRDRWFRLNLFFKQQNTASVRGIVDDKGELDVVDIKSLNDQTFPLFQEFCDQQAKAIDLVAEDLIKQKRLFLMRLQQQYQFVQKLADISQMAVLVVEKDGHYVYSFGPTEANATSCCGRSAALAFAKGVKIGRELGRSETPNPVTRNVNENFNKFMMG